MEKSTNRDIKGRFVKGSKISRKTFPTGENAAHWKGGRREHNLGYKWRYAPDHHFAVEGYVLEHRLVWEQHNNAILMLWANVHHKNGIRDDNRIENLEAMMKHSHFSLHLIGNTYAKKKR